MKPCSPRPQRKLLSRAAARNAALVNQFATPGLGSLMARRWIAGAGQLLLSVTGFAFVVAWVAAASVQLYRQIQYDTQPRPVGWIGEIGAAIFALAWLWALVTSLSLLREARRNETDKPIPPVLNKGISA
jgi:hypothetical protein